jgi:hypothetical protein
MGTAFPKFAVVTKELASLAQQSVCSLLHIFASLSVSANVSLLGRILILANCRWKDKIVKQTAHGAFAQACHNDNKARIDWWEYLTEKDREKLQSLADRFNVTQARALNLGENVTLRALRALQCSDGYAKSFLPLAAPEKPDAGEKYKLKVAPLKRWRYSGLTELLPISYTI